jgi:DNA helicase HerA-like ATPase
MADTLLIARGSRDLGIVPRMANRHGLVAGATGTGKTVTIHAMAERFSDIGVPVLLADIKGDLAGIALPGGDHPKVIERVQQLGLTSYEPAGYPVIFWDVFGEHGHPARTTISEMGPLLLSRLLGLNETQAGVLQVAFSYADDQGLLLLDLQDLRTLLHWVAEDRKQLSVQYGNVSPASIGAIQRGLLALEEAGGHRFFGEPALNVTDLMRTDRDGRGIINILVADRLYHQPLIYASFLLWLLSELFESLPEIGDPDKPRLVFFFDEAHLLFTDAPPALRSRIEQVIRLIRSKGVGVYFVSQSPLDIPDVVLGQLGNRVQHALRAFTLRDQRAVRAAAQTFRANPALDVESAITELGVGEALVSFLDDSGVPGVVERVLIIPPRSHIGPIPEVQRRKLINWSPVQGRYDQTVNRESAHEMLQARVARQEAQRAANQIETEIRAAVGRSSRKVARQAAQGAEEGFSDAVASVAAEAAREFGTEAGRGLVRGLLGALIGRRR